MGKQNASLKGAETPLDVTLEKAIELLANRNKKSSTIRTLVKHFVFDGWYLEEKYF
jgi:topoisomerase IA-like protein